LKTKFVMRFATESIRCRAQGASLGE